MEIKGVKQNGIIRVTLEGRLDMANAMEAELAFVKYAQSGNVFEIDMAKVDFISSAGIRALLSLYRTVSEQDGSVALINPTEQVLEVLDETEFLALFEVKSE